jgi:flagellar biogenesis protein FliO
MQYLQMIISLLGVLGLIFLLFFALRMFNRRISTSGGRLRVIDRASLGRDSMLLVVAVGGKLILVGVSAQRVEKISDLDVSEEEYIESAFGAARSAAPAVPFSDILSTVGASMGIRKKEIQKEDVSSDDVSSVQEEEVEVESDET